MTTTPTKPTVAFAHLGCEKNRVDTEHMVGLLAEAGYGVSTDESDAAVVVVNTCSFIQDAREESVRTLVNLAEQGKELIIAGCLAQHAADAEQIADLRAGPNQCLPGRHAAEHGDGQAQRATGGVAADQGDGAVAGHGIEATGEPLQPIRIGGRQGERFGRCLGPPRPHPTMGN